MRHRHTILLVDDEPLARYVCQKMIEKKFPTYSVIGEAATGSETLTAFRSLKPDIILMDIELPEINGLELSDTILKERAETQIIIVSAYESFGYAQLAVNTGVLGYVVKPIQEESLRSLLENASRNIESIRLSEQTQIELDLYRTLAIKEMVSAFMYGSYGGMSAEAFAQLLSPPISEGMFLFLETKGAIEEHTKVEGLFSRFSNCYVGHWLGSILPIFVSPPLTAQKGSGTPTIEEIEHFIKECSRYVKLKGAVEPSFFWGQWQSSVSRFPISFQQAFDSLYLNSAEKVDWEVERAPYPQSVEKKLVRALIHNDLEQAQSASTSFVSYLHESSLSATATRFAIIELFIQIRRNQALTVYAKLQEMIHSLLRVLDNLGDKEEMISWFTHAIESIIQTANESTSSEETIIHKVLLYIDLNDLGPTVSLEQVADFIGLTPQYISTLFKQQFNINFIDYIIQRRVDLACTLLKTTTLSVKEVATRCGYNDTPYFSKLFNKYTGMTPRGYRQKAR